MFAVMRAATVATTSSRALLSACAKLGMDIAALLGAAGLDAAQVNDPDGRLPGEAVAALWRAAFERSGDPSIGLRVAMAVPFGSYRVIDFLAASAPTVGEGMVRVARYFPLINSSLEWTISEEGSAVRMSLGNPSDPRGLPSPYAEYALAVTILHCRAASGFAWPLLDVSFAFRAPPDTVEHEHAFGCTVRFDQPHNEFRIARAAWNLASQAASTDLLRTLEQHADHLIAELREDTLIAVRVARLLAEELRGGDPSLVQVARRLAMSPRTLQRRLELEDTSFAEVLDRTRRHLARAYVKEQDLALTEVAYLLGFSEASAFTRAFQRWYGVAPSTYRARESAA
jgi:AraC-like DNA-binding protein